MFLSGIADEAGGQLESQIKAHRELGWSHIELRNVNGKQFTEATDDEFKAITDALGEAGLRISCFASALANWARPITGDFDLDVRDLERCLPRMEAAGCPFIRCMSWPNDKENPLPEEAWRDEAVRRMQHLAGMAASGGATLVLENCDGWASQSPATYKQFVELVGSDALQYVYDTGNPASHGHTNTWEWYQAARPRIAYVHIKANDGQGNHVWPDAPESQSRVAETVQDLRRGGYDGGFSIEPHMKAVVHEGKEISDAEAAFRTYVEYGRRLQAIVEAAD
jgi:sugar phosphate isomerase/epimerase